MAAPSSSRSRTPCSAPRLPVVGTRPAGGVRRGDSSSPAGESEQKHCSDREARRRERERAHSGGSGQNGASCRGSDGHAKVGAGGVQHQCLPGDRACEVVQAGLDCWRVPERQTAPHGRHGQHERQWGRPGRPQRPERDHGSDDHADADQQGAVCAEAVGGDSADLASKYARNQGSWTWCCPRHTCIGARTQRAPRCGRQCRPFLDVRSPHIRTRSGSFSPTSSRPRSVLNGIVRST